jgi:hypothetical protein
MGRELAVLPLPDQGLLDPNHLNLFGCDAGGTQPFFGPSPSRGFSRVPLDGGLAPLRTVDDHQGRRFFWIGIGQGLEGREFLSRV